MKTAKALMLIVLGLSWATMSLAQQLPAGAPAGSTGLCKDGSYWSGPTKRGACRGHKGVKEWYGAASGSAGVTRASKASAMTGAPASAPASERMTRRPAAGATGLCKDGSYWSGPTKRGACRGHKGVKEWYGAASGSAEVTSAPTPSSMTGAPVSAPASERMTRRPPAPSAAAAPGGGPGLVWVNHKSKVYHCPEDRWYGRTRDGEYMAEADAKAQGYRPDHGRPCR